MKATTCSSVDRRRAGRRSSTALRWVGVIGVVTSVITAAPLEAAQRGPRRTDDAASKLGEAIGRLGGLALIGWFIKRAASRKDDGRLYPSTIEPADPSDDGPQLVGLACVHCRQKIFTRGDAAPCTLCNQPVHHLECRNRHHEDAHGGA